MDRLRNPQKYRKQQVQNAAKAEQNKTQAQQAVEKQKNRMPLIVLGAVLGLILLSLLFIFSAQKKAENITSFLDPSTLKGLVVDKTFTANAGRKYIQISEGADRNVSAQELGSTLPVISRYNFRALTEKNYQIIGAAPYALTINITSNIEDPELLRYLFNQDKMIKSFLARKDVKPLLDDPALLAQTLGDEAKLKAFVEGEPIKEILSSDKVLEAIFGSRFMAYILISKTGKYYRDNPQEAAQLIAKSPILTTLKKDAEIQKVVKENTYLEKVAPTLLQ